MQIHLVGFMLIQEYTSGYTVHMLHSDTGLTRR